MRPKAHLVERKGYFEILRRGVGLKFCVCSRVPCFS